MSHMPIRLTGFVAMDVTIKAAKGRRRHNVLGQFIINAQKLLDAFTAPVKFLQWELLANAATPILHPRQTLKIRNCCSSVERLFGKTIAK